MTHFSKTDVESHLAEAIGASLRLSGHPVPPFSAALKIIKGIKGFDSHCGIEVTVDLEQRFGIDLGENIFIGDRNGIRYARTFSEVAAGIWTILKREGRTK